MPGNYTNSSKNCCSFRTAPGWISACCGISFVTWTIRFGVHHLAIRLENKQYGVVHDDALSVKLRQTKQLQTYPHSQIEMHEMLSCFDFERGLLLPDGKLELLLKARADNLESR